MTATATRQDIKNISKMCDMNEPVIIQSNPVLPSHCYFKILRPPSLNGFRRKDDEKPATMDLLRVLVLDRFIACVKRNETSKVIMIFVQSYSELNCINNYLRVQLKKHLNGKEKPWIVNNSSVGKITKVENQRRIENGEISLYITTSVMLCGLDLPRVDIVVISRPFSHLSSIIQAGGGYNQF